MAGKGERFLQGAMHAARHTPGKAETLTLLALTPTAEGPYDRLRAAFDGHTGIHRPDPGWDGEYARGWEQVMRPPFDPDTDLDQETYGAIITLACTTRPGDFIRHAIHAILQARARRLAQAAARQ